MSLADPHHRGCLLVNTALDAHRCRRRRGLWCARAWARSSVFCRATEAGRHWRHARPKTDVAATATALLGAVFAIRVMARLEPNPRRLQALADHALAISTGRRNP